MNHRLLTLVVLSLPCVALAQVPAKFTAYGTGCSAPNTQPPVLISTGPVVNQVFDIQVSNLQSSAPVLVILGLSDKVWQTHNVPLPQKLGFLGAPNCTLWASGECLEYCAGPTSGNLSLRFELPNDRSLVGKSVYMQLLAVQAGANAIGVASSSGYKADIGG